MKFNNKKKIIVGSIIGVLIGTLLSVSYAFFTFSKTNGTKSTLVTGDIYMRYKETNTNININDMSPRSTKPSQYFEFTVEGTNTTTDKDIIYDINIMHGDDYDDGDNDETNDKVRISDEFLRFTLEVDKTGSGTFTNVLENQSYSDFSTGLRIAVDNISRNTTNKVTHTYRLYVWIDSSVVIGNVGQDYTITEWNKLYASVKVNVTGDFTAKSVQTTELLRNHIINNLGSEGIVAVKNDGTLYVEGTDNANTIRDYRYSGSGRYCIYTDGTNYYNLQIEGASCPNIAYDATSIGMGIVLSTNDYGPLLSQMVGNGVTELDLKDNEDTVHDSGLRNYIYFKNNENENELWRIVGIVDGNIKIVKDTPLAASTETYTNTDNDVYNLTGDPSPLGLTNPKYGYFYYNYPKVVSDNSDDWSQFDHQPNDWTHAGAMYYLNEEDGYYGTIDNNDLIETGVTYHLGNVTVDSGLINGTASGVYTQERGTTQCAASVTSWSNNNSCNVWAGNEASFSEGPIGLLYPSDFGYAASTNYWTTTMDTYYTNNITANWMLNTDALANWCISPVSVVPTFATNLSLDGVVSLNDVDSYIGALRPVLNLISDTVITGGDGSYGNPFVLE